MNKIYNGIMGLVVGDALMRILPVAMLAEADPHDKMVTVKSIAGLTHNHPISHIACFIYAFMVENLINNVDKRSALSNAIQVAGGLAGIYYGCGGESGIPDEWIAQIPRKDWIKGLCDKFES